MKPTTARAKATDKRFTVFHFQGVPKEVARRLKIVAAQRDLTMTQAIVQAVLRYVEEAERELRGQQT
jgi:hypothetical protein